VYHDVLLTQVARVRNLRPSQDQVPSAIRIPHVVDSAATCARLYGHGIVRISRRGSGIHRLHPTVVVTAGHSDSFGRVRSSIEVATDNSIFRKSGSEAHQLANFRVA